MKGKDGSLENISKAKRSWLKISNAVLSRPNEAQYAKNASFSVDPDGCQDAKQSESLVLSHGMQEISSVKINRWLSQSPVKSVIQYEATKDYLIVFENGNLCLYENQGSGNQEIYQCKQGIISVVYTVRPKFYVAVCADFKLRILSQHLKQINEIPYSGTVTGILYNEFVNEVITYGNGAVTIWAFRTAYSVLVQRKIITDQIKPDDLIACANLEKTSSESQRLFLAIKKSVHIFSLLTGFCIKTLGDCHKADITSILHYQPLQILVTSGSDGSIKTWNNKWNLHCLFVGHTRPVTSVAIFPFGPFIMSTSKDHTLRTWSLDNCDEIDCKTLPEAALGVQSKFCVEDFYSYTASYLHLWKVEKLHSPFIVVGSKVTALKTTTHPKYPPRSHCISDDACVRIVNQSSYETITTMIAPDGLKIVDACYMISKDLLFVLLNNGEILKYSTLTNPCKEMSRWSNDILNERHRGCGTLVIYEYIADRSEEQDVIDILQNKKIDPFTAFASQNSNKKDRVLLLGGCNDGRLVVFDWENKKVQGKIAFALQAHKDKVTAICSCPGNDQIASTSPDLTVKVWRVFPYAAEALTPLLMFSVSEPATHITFCRQKLGVALQNVSTATYHITMYKTRDPDRAMRLFHPPEDDHNDLVTAMCACPKLRLFASASMDRSVRIWDEDGNIVRILMLNDVAHSLCFSSQRGDLLLGVGQNIHQISHLDYLPQWYRYRSVVMMFLDPVLEKPIPKEESICKSLTAAQRSKLEKTHSSFMKFMTFIDEIPADEQQRRKEEDKLKSEAFSVLEARDKELELIRDGKKNLPKRVQLNETEQKEVWQKYLALLYTPPSITMPDENALAFEDDDDEKFAVKITEPYQPNENKGFFMVPATKDDAQRIKKNLKEQREETLEKLKKLKEKEEQELRAKKKAKEKQAEALSKNVPSQEAKKENKFHRQCSKYTNISEKATGRTKVKKADENNEHPDQLTKNSSPNDDHEASSTVDGIPMLPLDIQDSNVLNVGPVEEDVVGEEILKPMPLNVHANQYPTKEDTVQEISKTVVKNYSAFDGMFFEDTKGFKTLPIAPDGFLPNSVVVALYRELRKEGEATEEDEEWRPKNLTEDQLAELYDFNNQRVSPSKFVEDDVVSDVSSDDVILPPIENETKATLNVISEMQKKISKHIPTDEELLRTPPDTPTPPRTPDPVIVETVKPEKVDPKSKIVKYIAPKPPPKRKVSTPKLKTPSPPPPPPPSPLPHFIDQFKSHAWFTKCFPTVDDNTMPKPRSLESFIELLLKHLKSNPDFDIKLNIISAILLLLHQEKFGKDLNALVQNAVLLELNTQNAPSAKSSGNELELLRKALQLLIALGNVNFHVFVELMVNYIMANFSFRREIQQTFTDLGIKDPRGYFTQELETAFNVALVASSQHKSKLKELCFDWMNKWTGECQSHITSLVGKICRASSGKVVRGTKSRKTSAKVKSILKSEESKNKGQKTITFVQDNFVQEAANNVTPVDVVNYFIEMKDEEALAIERERALEEQRLLTQKRDTERNTVLMLPRIGGYASLARLGETHQSRCHPERETSLANDFVLPAIHKKTHRPCRSLVLHLHTLTLNPFPEPLDELIYAPTAPELITLRSAQKYFVPALSVVTT